MATIAEALTLAIRHHQAGRLAEAEAIYRQVLQAVPDHADALHLLGLVARATGQGGQAIALIGRALALVPCAAFASNFGNVLADAGRLEDAAAAYEQALALDPAMAGARDGLVTTLLRLGSARHAEGRFEETVAACGRATALRPDDAMAHSNLGAALHALHRYEEAIAAFDRAIALRPGYPEAIYGRALTHQSLGDLEAAIPGYRHFLEQRPERSDVHSHLLVTLPFMPSVTPEETLAEHIRFGERIEAPLRGRIPAHPNHRDPGRVLRIGYLSPMFRAHILMQNLYPVFRHHRRDQVSVHVFAQEPAPDATTRRMQELADEWVFIQDLSDDAAAERVRASAIDILVHPMGHWYDNRLPVLARKPAPIQVSYTCNSSTTGLRAVDYSFVDPWLDFDGTMQALCVENLVSLSSGFLVTQYSYEPAIVAPPCRSRGHVTFGCFNNPGKLADATFALWARVLARVPDSRLLVKGGNLDNPVVAQRLRARLERHGVAGTCVECVGHLPDYGDHLALHGAVDIALDPVPFTGGRTTEDALWMGVPVVTLVTDTLHSRNSADRLWRMGHPELIARDANGFVAIAAALAHDPGRLDHYRRSLRESLRASSVMDFAGHTRQLEAAFRVMWQRWCAGEPPRPFRIGDRPDSAAPHDTSPMKRP